MLATDAFSSHTTGEQFRATVRTSCKSSSVIYLITCRRCDQQYMGENGATASLQNQWSLFGYHAQKDWRLSCGSTLQWQFTLIGRHDRHGHRSGVQPWSLLCKTQESRWTRNLTTSSPSEMNLRVNSPWSLPALPEDCCGLLGLLIINNINCIGLSHKGTHDVCVVYK